MRTFEKEFLRRHPERPQIVRFMREALKQEEVQWSDLTTSNLMDVADYFREIMSPNSARTYFAILSGFLNIYIEDGIVPCKKPGDVLRCKRVPSEQVVLTEEEISRIERYKPKTPIEKSVKAQFLCEYYCMARSSDIASLTTDNIRDGYITYVSQKTKVATSVPLHKNFLKYFHQRGKKHSRMTYNRTIKRICRDCGITQEVKIYYHGKLQSRPKYEYVGSHTARRSGATALANRGVPITTIAKLMNHGNNINTTMRYIISDTLALEPNALAFFHGEED